MKKKNIVLAEKIIKDLFKKLTIKAKITPEENPQKPNTLLVKIESEDSRLLIGQHGQTLIALQHVIRLLVDHQAEDRLGLVIDVNGYRDQRADYLQRMARTVAEKVARYGRFEVLRPMTAYERRLVHVALADNKEVRTESLGEDPNRRVVIRPLVKKRRSGEGRAHGRGRRGRRGSRFEKVGAGMSAEDTGSDIGV